MISQAYIFGTLGKAAFKQNEKWYVLDNNDPNTIRDWHTFDKNYLVLSNPEIVDLPQGKNLDDLRQLLALETTKQEALTLALQLMDESIPQEDIKTEIAELLGEYSQNSSIFQFLENRLLTTILPNSFSPSFAFNVCHSLQLHEIARMYELLTICSPEIQTFYTAWIKISKDYFQNAEKGDTAFRLLTTHGVAKAFVQSIVRQEKGIWDKAALDAALILQKEGLSANAMSFFMRLKTDLTQHFKIEFKEKISSLIDTEDNGDEIATIIETYLDNFFDERSGKKKGTNKNKKSNHARWEAVQSNVEFSAKRILNNLQEDNMAGARACLKDLISNQVKTSAPEHICKSLTNIASSLLSNSITSFTKTLLGYARILNSDDSVVYSLGAEVLKAEGNLSEAKSEYQRIKKQFPNDVVAQTGYAEILKAEGNLTEAKSEYQRIKKQFPNDVVAQTGYAEILKAEGNLTEAKSEYQRIKKQFPSNVVAQNGYAEILKAEGNLAEAKTEYQRIKKQFPNDVVAQTGYAEILKAEGNLTEAKSEYQRIKKQFPSNVVAQNGYAEILKAEGNLTEAKSEYQRIKKQFPSNVVAQNGYAEILKAEGNLAEAKTEYQRIKKQFPNDVFAQNGYAEILKAEGNLTEAKSEYQRIKKQFPNDAVAQNGYAEILKAEGNLAEAKTEYQRIKKQFLNNVVAQTGHAEILKAEGKISEAKEEYQRIKKQFPSNVVAQNGYAEILKAEGNLSEAKSEYQRIKKQFPNDVVAQNGYAEILKAEGKITEAKAEYQRIVNLWPNNQVALHALNSLLLVLGEPVTNVPPIPTAPQTSHDFYWLYFYTTKLIKEEHLVEAKRLAVLGMENCNFYELKLLFKRTKNYISLQLRDFDAAIADLHEYMEQHPIDHVLQTHAYAELNQQESARVELKKTMQFRGIPIIYDIACLLSEKYSINGLPKSNLPPDELTKRIREYEYQALVLI